MVTDTVTPTSRTSRAFRFDAETVTPVHWVVGLLSVVTGTLHVYLYLEGGFLPFLFAGVVFYAAVVAMLLNVYRRALYALGIPFTAGQIALWYLAGMPEMSVALVDKPVQVVLVVLLAYLLWTER